MRLRALHYLMILLISSVTPLPAGDQALLSMNEKSSIPPGQQRSCNSIPGDSPACYVGDPSNDILVIQQLDMIPNPIVMQVHEASSLTSTITDKC